MKPRHSKLNVVELYAGSGRSVDPFRSWRRAEVSLLVDSNRYAYDTYLLNHPRARYACSDMNALAPSDVVALAGGRIDVLLGCPPCQGFSESGNRREDDPRNAHIDRFAAVARRSRPLVVAMENVPLAWSSSRFQRFVRRLAEDGYAWTATIANAALYGSCQVRQRLLFLAFRGDLRVEPRFPRPTHGGGRSRLFSYAERRVRPLEDDPIDMLGISPATQRLAATLPQDYSRTLGPKHVQMLSDVIGDLPSIGSARAETVGHTIWRHSPEITRRMGRVPEGGRWSGGDDHFSHAYGRLHRRGLARTVTTCFPYAGAGRFWHPVDNRSLSLREAARIQGFPDSFQFIGPDRDAARIVGNALDYSFSSMIYRIVRRALE